MPDARPIRCSCCAQPITKEPVRVCTVCHRPILRGHKWQIRNGRLRHRLCRWPESYLTPAEYKKAYGDAMYRRMWAETKVFRGGVESEGSR
jgi:hypothetical protein